MSGTFLDDEPPAVAPLLCGAERRVTRRQAKRQVPLVGREHIGFMDAGGGGPLPSSPHQLLRDRITSMKGRDTSTLAS
jgi:hypothetical protein